MCLNLCETIPTNMCILNNFPSMCEFLPLCELQDLFVDQEQILLVPPCLMGFFYIIHGKMSTSHGHSRELCTSTLFVRLGPLNQIV